MSTMTEERAEARAKARDRRDGLKHMTHADGLCGPMASLCAACAEDERAWLAAWAEKQPAPRPGEDPEDYWRRIGGRFVDAWYVVAAGRIASIRHREGGDRRGTS